MEEGDGTHAKDMVAKRRERVDERIRFMM